MTTHPGTRFRTLMDAGVVAAPGAVSCGMGPMFPSTTMPKPALAGPAYLRAYLADPACARLPHLAISGITPDNLGELTAVGCRGVAVSSAVCGAEKPAMVCTELRAQLTAAAPGKGESPATFAPRRV